MASRFRGLVAVTCAAVIVGVIYMIWSDRAEGGRAEQPAKKQASLSFCNARLTDIGDGKISGDDQIVLSDCILNGHVSDDDIQRAYKKQ